MNDSGAPYESTPTWHGRAYSTKRDGVSLATCNSEPVRTPGCVQAHGALLVLRPRTLTVAQASKHAATILGHAVIALLERPVSDVIDVDGQQRLDAFLQSEPTERNPLCVFTWPGPGGLKMDVSVHTDDESVLLEFEPAITGAALGLLRGSGASSKQPAFVLLDLNLPGLDGRTTCRDQGGRQYATGAGARVQHVIQPSRRGGVLCRRRECISCEAGQLQRPSRQAARRVPVLAGERGSTPGRICGAHVDPRGRP